MCEDLGANASRLVVRWRLIVKTPTNEPTDSGSRKMSFSRTVPMTAHMSLNYNMRLRHPSAESFPSDFWALLGSGHSNVLVTLTMPVQEATRAKELQRQTSSHLARRGRINNKGLTGIEASDADPMGDAL